MFPVLIAAALLAANTAEYRTAGDPKAKGLDISLSVPLGWTTEDLGSPDIVQAWRGFSTADSVVGCTLSVHPADDWPADVLSAEFLRRVQGMTDKFRGADVVADQPVELPGGIAARRLWIRRVTDINGRRQLIQAQRLLCLVDAKLVAVECTVLGYGDEFNDRAIVEEPTIDAVLNSVRIKRPDPPAASTVDADAAEGFSWGLPYTVGALGLIAAFYGLALIGRRLRGRRVR